MPIDAHYENSSWTINYLKEQLQGELIEISLYDDISSTLTKDFIICVASLHEEELCKIIEDTAKDSTSNDHLVNFLKKKALSRQYHTFFSWKEAPNNFANQLFGLFGKTFLARMKSSIKSDSDLATSLEAFHYIATKRNQLMHNNYVTQSLDCTIDEILDKSKKSSYFIELFKSELTRCDDAAIDP